MKRMTLRLAGVAMTLACFTTAFSQTAGNVQESAIMKSSNAAVKFREEKTAAAKEAVYLAAAKEIPQDSTDNPFFGEMQCDLSVAWLVEGNPEKFFYYSKIIKPEFNNYYNVFHSLPILKDFAKEKKNLSANKGVIEYLLKEKKDVLDKNEALYGNAISTRGFILLQMGNAKEGLEDLSAAVKIAHYDNEVLSELKEAYIKTNGAKGYDKYINALLKESYKKTYEAVAKKKIADPKPAPQFTLKNLQGETVSLESYKGKVVVIDFWGTWCGWCIKAFPGMQMAIDEHKNDKDVVFLFVDAYEEEGKAKAKVQKFVDEKGYKFNMLLDEKNEVVGKFGYTGLPTKAIIDRKGNIAFEATGYDGSDAGVANSVKAMIEIAKKS